MLARTLSLEPWPIAIMMMTAATPMMMPSIERNERNLLLVMALTATLKRFMKFISECLSYVVLLLLFTSPDLNRRPK